ncbi:hypothetical protein VPHD254_0208 [Vibrio phage D254]
MAARYQKRLCTGLIVRNCDLDHLTDSLNLLLFSQRQGNHPKPKNLI